MTIINHTQTYKSMPKSQLKRKVITLKLTNIDKPNQNPKNKAGKLSYKRVRELPPGK